VTERNFYGRLLECLTESVFFGRYRSVFLGIYHTDTEGNSVGTFGIKKGAEAPFVLKRGAMAPFLRSSNPLLEKKGEERGEVYKKGGIPAVSDTGKYRYRKNDWYHHGK